ncbi:MAG: alpha/beta hydrolase-fold protein [Planctomycetaceae bacterium]
MPPLRRRRFLLFVGLLTLGVLYQNSQAHADEWSFRVTFDKSVHAEPYSGRVYLFFSRLNEEPRQGPDWFHPEYFIAEDVKNWEPGTPLKLSFDMPGLFWVYPEPLDKMPIGGYRAQAVVRFNPWEREVGTGAGNGFSQVVTLPEKAPAESIEFNVGELVPAPKFNESKWCKLLAVKSPRLSEFYGRDVTVNASVLLPASYYDEPDRRYPVMYTIPGFGGTHFHGQSDQPLVEKNKQGVEFIRVMLDPSCPLGHHVFADSENNGPWGTTLINDFIPALDKEYRSVAAPTARFLAGHSSGGWSSLWLQVTYPEQFGGVWSTAPDPVDFRDFQRINLYQPGENMYEDAAGERRPLARNGEQVLLWYQDFADMEDVLGPGGQLHSFEAVFSPRGEDGTPELLWNRNTGEIETDVAKTWERYDIRLVLERNWETLGPKLKGKLHVYMGEEDTFYLEGATRRLKESLANLNSDAVVEMIPGGTHFNLLTPALRNKIRAEMVETFLEHHP